MPGGAVDRDPVAFGDRRVADAEAPVFDVDVNVLAADDGALAHAARDDRGVARHPAARREHGARRDDAVKILRRRFVANENDPLAGRGALLGDVGIEHGDAARGAGARGEPGAERRGANAGVDHRMQQLVELFGRHALHRGRVSINPSSTMSVAMRTAAAAVRFPVRVCRR